MRSFPLMLCCCWLSTLGFPQQSEAFTPLRPSEGLSPPWRTAALAAPSPPHHHAPCFCCRRQPGFVLQASSFIIFDNEEEPEEPEEDEEEEEEPETPDEYQQRARSEFMEESEKPKPDGNLIRSSKTTKDDPPSESVKTNVDWGGALGRLRERVDDVESGKSQQPSQALFRLLSSPSPNQAIGSFVTSANPQIVQAMSGAISSLLGGLSSNPQTGVELLVKASGDKLAQLCFQLQMTGYMFRNAEYIVALKEIMNLGGSATLQDYKEAFERLDSDGSGFIETAEIEELLDDVYKGETPGFEIDTFMKFFDQNKDGKISWDEFERGLGTAMAQQNQLRDSFLLGSGPDDEDEEIPQVEPQISGTVQVELEDGEVVEVDAKEYMDSLKAEAQELKSALLREKRGANEQGRLDDLLPGQQQPETSKNDDFVGIIEYISSRQGDLKSLTEGISPDIVETMKMLVDFVLEGGQGGRGKNMPKEKMQLEIPGGALQQLALWQLILGYRLREAEAKGDYLKLLE